LPFISKGSQKFEIIPIGKETLLSLTSNWADPDFSGDFLPSHREINQKGFKADWRVLEMNRPFAQQFTELPMLNSFALGVR